MDDIKEVSAETIHSKIANSESLLKRSADVYPKDLSNTLIECWKDELFTDVVFKCRKENDWVTITANTSVLAASSPFLKRIFSSSSNILEHYIVMDNFSYKEMHTLVHYAYTGEIVLGDSTIDFQYLSQLFELKVCVQVLEEKDELPIDEKCSNESDSPSPVNDCVRRLRKSGQKKNSSPAKICDICGKTFARPALMLNHRRVHTGEKPFRCHVCNNEYREKSHLTRHLISHSENNRPYVCDINDCRKTFTNHFYLSQHKITHTGQKRFLCDFCGFQCYQASDLKKHNRKHTQEKPYSCEFCGKGFTQKSSCITHKNTAHRSIYQPSEKQNK